jgi:hypothetical protein
MLDYYFLFSKFIKNEIIVEIIINIIILVITKLILNICVPYNIKYPIPAFDVRNSPIITPP